MTRLTDRVVSNTSFTYDKRGLLLSKTDPLGKTSSFVYDNAGRLISKTDRNNDTIAYTQENRDSDYLNWLRQ